MTANVTQTHKATLTSSERTTAFALIGAGHTMSHIYILTLPPLFFLIKADLGISYAALGLLVTVFHVATGICQIPSGFLVDRIGARVTLTFGMLLIACSMGAIGLVDSYWLMVAMATLAGVGNSVFHPADYAVLAASVDDRHLGKAFGFHLLAGNLGFAAAPVLMVSMAAVWGWHGALVGIGAAGIAVSVAMMIFGSVLRTGDVPAKGANEANDGTDVRVLTSPRIIVMLSFFLLLALSITGIQTFSVTVLVDMFEVELATANTALTIFLAAGFVGVAIGGFIADRLKRPVFVISASMLIGAACLALVGAVPLPVFGLFAAMAVGGVFIGIMRPARDMMVNAITPPGATGKVFGFVGTGLSTGGAIAPVSFGWIIDQGATNLVFVVIVALILGCAGIAIVVDRMGKIADSVPKTQPADAAAE
jgi:MFS transporter, FSR family, fosmidomycin resistance protein